MFSLRCGAIKQLVWLSLLVTLASPWVLAATSYSCAGSGTRHWHTATDWTPNGIPAAGDTVTITAGCTMQCESNNMCAAGTAGNPGTVDLTIAVGGDLIVESGASLDMRGDVTMPGELDVFGGTFTLDPAAASGAVLYYIDGGGDVGADTLKVCSESTCTLNGSTLGVLSCNKGSSGSCQIRHNSHQGNGMNVLGSHGQINNFGTSMVAAISLLDGALPPNGGFVLKNNFSLHNNGVVQVDYESPTVNLTFDGVSFDTLVDINGSYNGHSFLDLLSHVQPTSGDRTFRVTCANSNINEALLNLSVTNAAVGDATHPGLVAYNCVLLNGSSHGTFQNALSIVDRNVTSGSSLFTIYNANATFENWVMYDHTANQHHIVGVQMAGNGTSNTYKGMVFDGDGYSGFDTGDDYQDFGAYTASNGLHINGSGTVMTMGATGNEMASLDHETVVNSFGGTLCETSCSSTMLQKWSDSLFVLPAVSLGAEYPGNDGLHNAGTFNVRQTSNSAATDYNFFWQMPGSGDPGANPPKTVHIQLNLGSTPSWVAITDPAASFVRNQQAMVQGVDVHCVGCFSKAQAKDYVIDTSEIPNTYAVIESITDPDDAVLYTSIPNYSTGDLIDVRPGYFASNGLYGVDWGSHDQHLNPLFQDSTRTVCSWWKQVSGSTARCSWTNFNNYTAGSGTTNTVITDNSVDFNVLGVQDGLDVVFVYSPGWSPMGSGTVLSHSSHSLNVTSIPGAMSGDSFTFITAPAVMGQAAVQLYGFDINGNLVTPPAWVNANMVQGMESYLQQGYAPTNLGFYGAGSDGRTVGAFEVLPANAAISVTAN